MNYFELFGLPEAPSVDRSALSRKYFELQKDTHPDFFTQGTETEKEQALERSATINKAFNIFQNEEKTIEYFLQLNNIIETDEKYDLPPGFLMEMMEINEAITEEDQGTARSRIAVYENELAAGVMPIIKSYDPTATSRASLLQLKDYYYKKKYLKRILDRLGD